MARKNEIAEKSKLFALRIIRLYQHLREEKKESVLSKQLLRSGTSIGANVREALRAQSDADFYAKLTIALKEADESAYWLELLFESSFIDENTFNRVYGDCEELIRLLVAITRTLKRKIQSPQPGQRGGEFRFGSDNSEFRIPNSELPWLNLRR